MKRLLILLCFILTGCQTAMVLPDVREPAQITRVDKHIEQSPFGFAGAAFDIPRGTPYLTYPFWRWSVPNVDVGFYLANYSSKFRLKNSEHFWGWDEKPFTQDETWDTDVEDYFARPMSEMGYDVTIPKKSVFKQRQEDNRAEIQVAATFVDIKMNVIHFHDMIFGNDQRMQGGESYVKVNWEIYDPLRKKVLAHITTEGRAQVDEGVNKGYDLLLLKAFQNAARNLGQTKEFYKLVTNRSKTHPYPEKKTQSYLEIETDKKPYTQGIQKDYTFIRRGVVVVRTAGGHGSGFYINDEGYALTNAHVVGDSETVAIIDFSGTQHMAEVIRVDEQRDVALIKAEVTRNSVLPISKKYPKMTDRVYAIGAPNSEGLKGTITEGIISSFRKRKESGLAFIQASIELAPGNSGGPLVDEFGNVIAMAAEVYAPKGKAAETEYSYFIPIDEALNALNIHIVKPNFP